MDRESDNWEAKKLKGKVEKKVDLDRCGITVRAKGRGVRTVLRTWCETEGA